MDELRFRYAPAPREALREHSMRVADGHFAAWTTGVRWSTTLNVLPLPRLITFRPSHYCEKARWALERAKVAYREEPHVPVLSWAATYGAGAKRTVPALVISDRVLPDSTDILRVADEQKGVEPLFPPDLPEAVALEEHFDQRLGPATRMIGYFHFIHHQAQMKPLLLNSAKGWESAAGRVLFPLIRGMIIRGLRVDAEHAARARRSSTTLSRGLQSSSLMAVGTWRANASPPRTSPSRRWPIRCFGRTRWKASPCRTAKCPRP